MMLADADADALPVATLMHLCAHVALPQLAQIAAHSAPVRWLMHNHRIFAANVLVQTLTTARRMVDRPVESQMDGVFFALITNLLRGMVQPAPTPGTPAHTLVLQALAGLYANRRDPTVVVVPDAAEGRAVAMARSIAAPDMLQLAGIISRTARFRRTGTTGGPPAAVQHAAMLVLTPRQALALQLAASDRAAFHTAWFSPARADAPTGDPLHTLLPAVSVHVSANHAVDTSAAFYQVVAAVVAETNDTVPTLADDHDDDDSSGHNMSSMEDAGDDDNGDDRSASDSPPPRRQKPFNNMTRLPDVETVMVHLQHTAHLRRNTQHAVVFGHMLDGATNLVACASDPAAGPLMQQVQCDVLVSTDCAAPASSCSALDQVRTATDVVQRGQTAVARANVVYGGSRNIRELVWVPAAVSLPRIMRTGMFLQTGPDADSPANLVVLAMCCPVVFGTGEQLAVMDLPPLGCHTRAVVEVLHQMLPPAHTLALTLPCDPSVALVVRVGHPVFLVARVHRDGPDPGVVRIPLQARTSAEPTATTVQPVWADMDVADAEGFSVRLQ
jgi:hypothetical protein